MNKLNLFTKVIKHLKTILTHKYYVFLECKKYGLYWRGLTHDLSKFSPTEFINSIKYYREGTSPVNVSKEEIGYSLSWQHHKGRNTHHHVYWCENFDDGDITIIPMPFVDCIECVCDYYAAGKAYEGKDYTYYDELMWFRNKITPNGKLHMAMHPYTAEFIHSVIYDLSAEMYEINMDELKSRYDEILNSGVVPIPVRYSDPINIEYFNKILKPWLAFKIQKK